MVSSVPTSSPGANSESVAAVVVALAAAVGGVLGWGGVRLCDSLVRTMEEEGARVVAVRERERERVKLDDQLELSKISVEESRSCLARRWRFNASGKPSRAPLAVSSFSPLEIAQERRNGALDSLKEKCSHSHRETLEAERQFGGARRRV